MFPLSTVLFPGAGLPLHVFEERYRSLMTDCMDGNGEFGVVLIARGSEVGGGDQRLDVGTVARISRVAELGDGRLLVVSVGVRRLRVSAWLEDNPYPRAVVGELPAITSIGDGRLVAAAESSVRRLRSLLSELGDVPALPHDLELVGDGEDIGWQLCDLAPLNPIDLQHLLVTAELGARMTLLTELCNARSGDVIGLLAGGDGA
jgi:uncharacterized protein